MNNKKIRRFMSKRQSLKREVNDTKGHPTLYIQNKLTRSWQKTKPTKRYTTVHKTQHR